MYIRLCICNLAQFVYSHHSYAYNRMCTDPSITYRLELAHTRGNHPITSSWYPNEGEISATNFDHPHIKDFVNTQDP